MDDMTDSPCHAGYMTDYSRDCCIMEYMQEPITLVYVCVDVTVHHEFPDLDTISFLLSMIRLVSVCDRYGAGYICFLFPSLHVIEPFF